MAMSIQEVFGSGASLNASALSIPTNNLAVISGVTADYTNGAEAVFAILEHLANDTSVPLSSGYITSSVSTSLTSGNKLRKSYSFVFNVGNIALNDLDVVEWN